MEAGSRLGARWPFWRSRLGAMDDVEGWVGTRTKGELERDLACWTSGREGLDEDVKENGSER